MPASSMAERAGPHRLPEPKPALSRQRAWHRCSAYAVMVLDEHFAWNSTTYRSLTEIAVAMTGTRWSGPRFFGLRDRPKRSA